MTTLELAQALLEDIKKSGEVREVLVDYGIEHDDMTFEGFVSAQEGFILVVS